MKVVKGIGLFFVLIGVFVLGCWFGMKNLYVSERLEGPSGLAYEQLYESTGQEDISTIEKKEVTEEIIPFEHFLDAATLDGILASDTEYVVLETDILRGTSVEQTNVLPELYVGMTRQQLENALNQYAAAPPLSERKRGFIGLELISFSRDKVVVRMDYRYVQPGEHFYLAIQDHQLVVYLEDKSTIYINTGISDEKLSDEFRTRLMDMIAVETERELYDYLENYTS